MMKKIESVDEYINHVSPEYKSKLQQLRKIIKNIVPEAEERISYSMPYYGYKGRLVYFALAKKHVGLYIPPPVIAEHEDLLKKYKTSKSAIQFPLNEELPTHIIQKLVIARKRINEKLAK